MQIFTPLLEFSENEFNEIAFIRLIDTTIAEVLAAPPIAPSPAKICAAVDRMFESIARMCGITHEPFSGTGAI